MTARVRLTAAAALAAAALVAGALVLATRAGGDDGAALRWAPRTQVFTSDIPTDKILAGRLENTSLREVDLDVEDVVVLDASGRRVQSALRFREAFAHGLYAWSQRPPDVGDFERRRLGEIATIKPGESVPINLSWRVPDGAAPPVRVDFGPATIALPRTR